VYIVWAWRAGVCTAVGIGHCGTFRVVYSPSVERVTYGSWHSVEYNWCTYRIVCGKRLILLQLLLYHWCSYLFILAAFIIGTGFYRWDACLVAKPTSVQWRELQGLSTKSNENHPRFVPFSVLFIWMKERTPFRPAVRFQYLGYCLYNTTVVFVILLCV